MVNLFPSSEREASNRLWFFQMFMNYKCRWSVCECIGRKHFVYLYDESCDEFNAHCIITLHWCIQLWDFIIIVRKLIRKCGSNDSSVEFI